MSPSLKIAIVAALALAVAGIFVMKQSHRAKESAAPAVAAVPVAAPAPTTPPARLPRLVDLGADKCIPCKMMAPILEDLKTNYAGRLQVEFIDVWKNEGAGQAYGIRMIPTQIFISSTGQELFRHEGFFSKDDILAKWKEFGVELSSGTNP